MSNELKELMQISVIGENKDLSNMIINAARRAEPDKKSWRKGFKP